MSMVAWTGHALPMEGTAWVYVCRAVPSASLVFAGSLVTRPYCIHQIINTLSNMEYHWMVIGIAHMPSD